MNLERERLVLRHLEDALAWPMDEREERLAAALRHDPPLLTDVRERLQAARFVNEALPTGLHMTGREADAPAPEQLGPYRVKELLGQGGMGRVYRAERADGAFERAVAVKLMRRSRVPELLAAQFARETRILAGLEHRHIAQLLDAGVTPDGQSYIVMELVAGRVITQYAAEENLSLRATLRLYLQVCSAVRFAHARLVVHADIKPNNIIVVAGGTAKLLDFGVAQVLADVDEALSLRLPLALTPGYASPSRQRGEPATTADDVFSLGVLLHDLLERCPHVPEDLGAVRDRARAPDLIDRYASVETLQADLERWLGSFPVQAHRANLRYVAGKFVTRHRMAVAAACAALMVLAGALAALAFLYARAERARASAEERFTELRSFSRFVLFDVYDRLESTPRALTLRRDLAEAAQGYLDRLARDPEAPAALRLDLIEGFRRLAQVQASPGSASVSNAKLAGRNLDHAEALAKTLPVEGELREERALILARLALARVRLASALESDLPAANQALDRATARLAEAEQAAPGSQEVANLRNELVVEHADILQWQARYAEAIQITRAALSQPDSQSKGSAEEQKAAVLRRTKLLDLYAEGLYYAGDMQRSEQAYREEMELLKSAYAAQPDNPPAARRFMRSEWALAEALLELKRAAEAEPLLADAVALGEKLQFLEPQDRDLARTAIVISTAHARALAALGRFREGLRLLEQSTAARKKLWDEAPEDWSAARDYAIGVASLAEGRLAARQIPAACVAWAESLATFERIRVAGRAAELDESHTIRIVREGRGRYCH
ncbi:MAG: serine/threonine-protein kinase [Gammaproteobacteria bacterium]